MVLLELHRVQARHQLALLVLFLLFLRDKTIQQEIQLQRHLLPILQEPGKGQSSHLKLQL